MSISPTDLPFYGSLYACIDDPGVASVLPKIAKPIVTYGLTAEADIRATDVTADGVSMRFAVHRAGRPPLKVAVRVAGLHNVRNTLAAVAIAQDLGVSDDAIVRALANFGGVGRRFQRFGVVTHQSAKFELIDDYGHHPVELRTTLAAAGLLSRAPTGAGLPAASIHPHPRPLRGFCIGALGGRCAAAG